MTHPYVSEYRESHLNEWRETDMAERITLDAPEMRPCNQVAAVRTSTNILIGCNYRRPMPQPSADAERGLSRVMTCHRRFFDRAYVSEGLRRDGDQDAEHDLRNACVQFLIHSFLSKKDKHRRLLQGLFEKESLVFFLLFVLQRRFHPFFISVIAFQWVPYATADA